MPEKHDILPGMLKTGAGTLASRILGLLREVISGPFFGTGAAFDMFVIAFRVPNLFRGLFGEGALNASFIPVFTREGLDPAGDARRLLNAVMTALAALLMGITCLGWLICGIALLSGRLPANGKLFCLLLMILLPYLPLICLTALQGAALNVKGHFLRPAFAPTIMNICWIGAIVLMKCWRVKDLSLGVTGLAVGVLISGGLQFAYQAMMLRRCNLHFRLVWDLAHPGLRQIVQLTLPVALGVGVIQINTFVDSLFAQFCVQDSGANSALWYGNNLMQFPLAVLGTALATAVLPALAHHEAVGDRKSFVDAVGLSLRTAFFVSLPCVAATVALSEPIVRVLYQRGRFTPESTARTAAVFLCFTAGLWAFCAIQVLARAFYAQQDVRAPRRIAVMMVGANFALNAILVWPMREAGLALSSSICGVGNMALLWIHLRRKIGPIGGRAVAASAMKSAVAAAVAGFAGYGAFYGILRAAGGAATGSPRAWPQLLALTCGLAAVCAVFLLAAWALRATELREFAQSFRRKKDRASSDG
jgi:putative peptidoglycan lipid II flippase